MRREDYDTLKEILEEYRQEEAGLRIRIEANCRYIRESQAHLNAYSESEPEDFRYFSPRSAENIHREEIKSIQKEISVREEQNKKLQRRKNILERRISCLRDLIERREPEAVIKSSEENEVQMDSSREFPAPVQPLEADREKISLLTSRETEILVRIAGGMLNKEIADSLKISERTVKNHISSIFRKLNVWDRTQAAVFAIRNRIVELE